MSYHALPPGTVLDRNLEVKRVLGVGGFGITYLVHDRDLQQELVLKEFFPPMWARRVGENVVPNEDPQARTDFAHYLMRFLEEARLAARIRHPHLVRVHRFIEANGTGYFGMEWAEGETLEQLFTRENDLRSEPYVLTPQAALALVEPLLDGLQQLHAAGLIHRDIKPANIYLRRSGGPMLIDFGAARAPGSDKRLTAILSPGYAPPEQYSEDGIQGPHTDVYAVGAVLYRVLTGKEPLDAYTRSVGANASTRHVSCSERAPPGVPPALCAVIDRAMALNIHERFADVSSLRAALLRAVMPGAELPATGPVTVLPVTAAPTQVPDLAALKRKRGCAITITIAFSFAGAGLLVLPQLRSPVPRPVAESASMPAPAMSTPPPAPISAPAAEPNEPVVASAAEPMPEPAAEPDEPLVASAAEPVTEPVSAVPPPRPVAASASPAPAWQALRASVFAAMPPADLEVNLTLEPPQTVYLEGEQVSVAFSSAQPVHVALFLYRPDGAVQLVYPSTAAEDAAGRPGLIRDTFRLPVKPPFGAQALHLIAFREPQDLQRLLTGLLQPPGASTPLMIDPMLWRGFWARWQGRESGSPIDSWGEALLQLRTAAR